MLSALTITADVTHPVPSRLVFQLRLPDGTLIPLTNNYPNLTISGTALANLLARNPQVHGQWLLFVRDPVTGTTPFRGTLNFWTLNLTYNRTLSQPAVTDASGNYVFTGLAPTSYTVTPFSPAFNFSPVSADVTITNTDVSGVDFDATALPASLVGLTIVPSQVRSGLSATGTVTLTGPVSTNTLVNLSSDNAGVIVPGSVTVLAGQTSASFVVNTNTVDTSTTGTVTASVLGSDATATLTVLPAGLLSFTISPNSVDGGGSVNGTVTLSGGAPAGGAVITLRSSSPIVQAPRSVTLTQGQTTFTFPITTTRISGAAVVRVTASFNGVSQTATLTVIGPLLGNIIPRPATLRGGTFGFLRVNLVRPAPASGVTVNLSSSNPSVVALSQDTVVFNQGQKVKQVSISAARVTLSTRVTLTATQNGITRQTVVTVNP